MKRPIIIEAGDMDYGNGICTACGAVMFGGHEPDARERKCEDCGKLAVYGMEEAILSGLATPADDADLSRLL